MLTNLQYNSQSLTCIDIISESAIINMGDMRSNRDLNIIIHAFWTTGKY